MAIREEVYERYIATEMIFEQRKQALRAKAAEELRRNYETAEYYRGFADGLDKSFEIMLDLLYRESAKSAAEIERLKEALREAEYMARRPQWWRFPQ